MDQAQLWSHIALLLVCIATFSRALDDFYFSRHPQNLVVREGGSVDLECMVSNTSYIRFYWQLDGETVTNSSRRYQRGSGLHITRVDRVRDRGHFTCIAMNVTTGFSLTSLAASLSIQWLDRQTQVELQSPEDPSLVVLGSDVVLRCQVDGSGDISYTWFHNGVRLLTGRRVSLRNRRLQISQVELADAGTYSCAASNAAGTASSSRSWPLVVQGMGVPRLVLAPQDQLVRRGDVASFDCRFDGAATINWFFADLGPLSTHGRYSILDNGSLVVAEVDEGDEGWYHCVASSAGADGRPAVPQRYTALLRLAYIEPLTGDAVEPQPSAQGVHVVPEGRPFQLTCLAPAGLPTPSVRWLEPSGTDVTDTTESPSPGTAVLSLDSSQVNDSGNYSCVAENIAGNSTLHVQILAATPPELLSGPVDLVVDEGERTELMCQFRGLQHPFTDVSWLKDSRPVRAGQTFRGNGSLVLPLTELSHAGRYQCVVNSTGFPPYRSSQALLTVKEKLKFAPRPVSRGLELGKPGKLYCRASGSTPPSVSWVKLDSTGHPQFEWPPHIQDRDGTLMLERVLETDGGQYTCVATNPQGFINATINVTIVVTPKFLVTPSKPVEAVVGSPLLLDCPVYGRPQPSVQWDRNSRLNLLDVSRFVQLENGSLYIRELRMSDTARYGCIAGNSGGFSRQETQVIVRGSEAELTGGAGAGGSDDGALMSRTVAITVSAAAAYLLLVAGLMAWCRYRRLQRKQLYGRGAADGSGPVPMKQDRSEPGVAGAGVRYVGCPVQEDTASVPASSSSVTGPGRVSPARYNSYQSIGSQLSATRGPPPSLASATRPGDPSLQPVMPLGQGDFGDVYLARCHGYGRPEDQDSIVMVKSLLQPRDDAALSQFAHEAELFGKVAAHVNVARLLAIVKDSEPHLLVLQYSDWGDLKQFLLATRPDSQRGPPRPPPISPGHAYSLCHQLASGLEHIHSHRFVHRDLAARNCLVTSALEVKISLRAALPGHLQFRVQ